MLAAPHDLTEAGWRRVNDVQDGYWDGQRWTQLRYLPGVVQTPATWIGVVMVLTAAAIAMWGGTLAAMLFAGYLLPSGIAVFRPPDWWKFNAGAVSLVGILAGWTVIGWVAALIMAVMKDRPPA